MLGVKTASKVCVASLAEDAEYEFGSCSGIVAGREQGWSWGRSVAEHGGMFV